MLRIVRIGILTAALASVYGDGRYRHEVAVLITRALVLLTRALVFSCVRLRPVAEGRRRLSLPPRTVPHVRLRSNLCRDNRL